MAVLPLFKPLFVVGHDVDKHLEHVFIDLCEGAPLALGPQARHAALKNKVFVLRQVFGAFEFAPVVLLKVLVRVGQLLA